MKKNEQITPGSTPRLLRRQPLTRAGRFHDYKLTDALQQLQVSPSSCGGVHPDADAVPQLPPPSPARGRLSVLGQPRRVPTASSARQASRRAWHLRCRLTGSAGLIPCSGKPRCDSRRWPRGGLGDERWLLSLSRRQLRSPGDRLRTEEPELPACRIQGCAPVVFPYPRAGRQTDSADVRKSVVPLC